MRFEFATATNIIFGPGTLAEIPALAAEMGRRFFVVTGSTDNRAAPLLEQMKKQGIKWSIFHTMKEPTIDTVLVAVETARQSGCDGVMGIGGGSVLDTGKAVAALLTNPGELRNYLEVVGDARPLARKPAPYIAIPTTAGTGAEVTRNAVIGVPDHGVKVSMRSPLMLPDLAVVDPELTTTMPPTVTAATGMDALTQLVEPYVSGQANPMTDGICREGLLRVACSLERAYTTGGHMQAREDMALAALFGGLALANAKVGAVHGIAGPMGGMVSAPHGMICARLLPFVTDANIRALKSRAPDSPALIRYAEIAQILTGSVSATAEDGVRWLHDLCAALNIPPLSQWGLSESDFPVLVAKSCKASSMKGNPIGLTETELTDILQKAYEHEY